MSFEVTLWNHDQRASAQPLPIFKHDTRGEKDFIEVVQVKGLAPNTSYEVRASVTTDGYDPAVVGAQFVTAHTELEDAPIRWVWGGDIGGQGYCRKPDRGYGIFDHMRESRPDFGILLGDLIYGDGPCPSPPNIPGSDFVATTLEQFRAKHRYQREDTAFQQFLASVPVYAQWDDHEVRNDFSGSTDVLMPIGLQAFHEYWPNGISQERPPRLYRQIHRGANLDLFFLDTRQYRSPNTELDNSQKTMLGKEQLSWLVDTLTQSQATWKVIVSSVPLSLPKGDRAKPPAVDSWAQGQSGTGFAHERNVIVETILFHQISNVVWITTDVHVAQVLAYDPHSEGKPAFHEFVCGPLSAGPGRPTSPETTLNPTVLYSDGGFFNFGEVVMDQDELNLRIVDDRGTTKFQISLPAQP